MEVVRLCEELKCNYFGGKNFLEQGKPACAPLIAFFLFLFSVFGVWGLEELVREGNHQSLHLGDVILIPRTTFYSSKILYIIFRPTFWQVEDEFKIKFTEPF